MARGRFNAYGRSRLGGLLILVVLVAGVYYGVDVIAVYLDYVQMRDEMKAQVRLAPSLDDDDIRRRLLTKADELDLPEEARKITIRRTPRPRQITISTSWEQTVDLPFFRYTFKFRPEAKAPL